MTFRRLNGLRARPILPLFRPLPDRFLWRKRLDKSFYSRLRDVNWTSSPTETIPTLKIRVTLNKWWEWFIFDSCNYHNCTGSKCRAFILHLLQKTVNRELGYPLIKHDYTSDNIFLVAWVTSSRIVLTNFALKRGANTSTDYNFELTTKPPSRKYNITPDRDHGEFQLTDLMPNTPYEISVQANYLTNMLARASILLPTPSQSKYFGVLKFTCPSIQWQYAFLSMPVFRDNYVSP